MYIRLLILLLAFIVSVSVVRTEVLCRDPDLGGQASVAGQRRKFLLIGGAGAGIGNFLVFYPAAYYFAVFSGRDVLIMDDSLLGEMCSIMNCGFPKLSEVALAFPSLLGPDKLRAVRGAKVYDFHRHLSGEMPLDQTLVRADGYRFMSGWYLGRNTTMSCVTKLTGCQEEDVDCHDRHALQRLVRGPFKTAFTATEEQRIIGVPKNYRHAIMTLPHSYAPLLDAAVHLRCQFQHFERLVGPDDGESWITAQKETWTWLNSTDGNKGQQLFKTIEGKIMEQIAAIRGRAKATRRRRLQTMQQQQYSSMQQLSSILSSEVVKSSSIVLSTKNNSNNNDGDSKKSRSSSSSSSANNNHSNSSSIRRQLMHLRQHDGKVRSSSSSSSYWPALVRRLSTESAAAATTTLAAATVGVTVAASAANKSVEDEVYTGEDTGRIYVYIASDNEIVKEAFAAYLSDHKNIAVMRVKNNAQIAHAKNLGHLKQAGNNTGVMDLVLDWYSLSLANFVFAWRRDTDLLSTFAHSAQRLRGHTEKPTGSAYISHGVGSKGFQLIFKGKGPTWREF